MMKKFLSVILTLIFIVQFTIPVYAAETARSIVIFEVTGDVTMTKGTSRSFKASVNQRMANGYTITTGKDSSCILKLDEDSLVKVDKNSKVQFSDAKGKKLSISVLSGAITVNAAEQNPGDSVEVRAGNSALAIRGTLFVVENLPDDKVLITMLSGSGEVGGVILDAGEIMHVYDTEQEQLHEKQTLEINENLSLAVLEVLAEHIDELVAAGLVNADEVEEIASTIGGLIDEKQAQENAPPPEENEEDETEEETEDEVIRLEEAPAPDTGGDSGAYDSTAQDNYDIAAALSKVSSASYTAAQLNADSLPQAKTAAEAIIANLLASSGVTAAVTGDTFTAAQSGTVGVSTATNGQYTFYVTLSKGSGTPQTTGLLILNITALVNDFNGGDGTSSAPWEIANPQQLARLAEIVNNGSHASAGKYYKLTGNIDLGNYSTDDGWVPIGTSSNSFNGSLDGGGCDIVNLKISRPSEDKIGLFGVIGATGTVKNIKLTGSYGITGKGSVGSLAGESSGTVTNITNSINVNGSEDYVGGIVGLISGTLTGSTNNGTVACANYAGGVVGEVSVSGSVIGCVNNGVVNGGESIGGVVGRNRNNVTNCTNKGGVSGTDRRVGGIVGYNTGDITDSNNSGSGYISGKDSVGGIAGCNQNSDGKNGKIENCQNSGAVEGENDVGGVVGMNLCVILNSSNGGAVTGTGTGADAGTGGVAGVNGNTGDSPPFYGTVTNSHNTGNVTGLNLVGGVVGRNNSGTIDGCDSEGTVGGAATAGGIVGRNGGGGTVKNCEARNTSVTTIAAEASANIGRVVGQISGASTLQNNSANANMTLAADGITVTVTPASDGKHGADISSP